MSNREAPLGWEPVDPIDLVKLTEVARIIDPLGWQLVDEVVRVQLLPQGAQPTTQTMIDAAFQAQERKAASLAKAEAILALINPTVLRLIQRLGEVEAALAPFAKFRIEGFDGEVLEVVPSSPENPARRIEPIWTSHFRRARSALSTVVPPVGEGKQGVMVSRADGAANGDPARSAPEAAALLEALRPLILAANEQPPKPAPEQDSRVGEAMAGRADAEARNAWKGRVDTARLMLSVELAKAVKP